VLSTKAGHVLEVDDTPGVERISILHTSGSSIQLDAEGNIVISGKKSTVLESPSPLHITCTDSVTITTPETLITGNLTVNGDTRVDGGVSVGDDVNTDSGISLNNHTHKVVGVQPGAATRITNKPQ
jgi:phage baseplate assembly protein gpV